MLPEIMCQAEADFFSVACLGGGHSINTQMHRERAPSCPHVEVRQKCLDRSVRTLLQRTVQTQVEGKVCKIKTCLVGCLPISTTALLRNKR